MSFSTADFRLKKLMLFSLLSRLSENICFRCNLPITTPDELTLEHKQPWLDVDPSLFWDVNNISFSHPKCNSTAVRYDTTARKNRYISQRFQGTTGTAWCRLHQAFLPVVSFSKNSKRWNGLQSECNECRKHNPSRKPKSVGHGSGLKPL